MLFALSSFRDTQQAHGVQSRSQVRLDYSQKERAFLQALLEIVPNAAMRAMMNDSNASTTPLDWEGLFNQAIIQTSADLALDPATASSLGITATAISANTGNSTFSLRNADGTLSGLITAPGGTNLTLPSTSTASIPNLPTSITNLPNLNWNGPSPISDVQFPIVSLNKTPTTTTGTNPLSQYSIQPYPAINFGYTTQGSNFIAKRNWWAFTVNFGANTSNISGINGSSHTYVLSLYEVPAQLAISSAGASTNLGQFGDNSTDWTNNITIQGSIYAESADIRNANRIGGSSVATRNGVTSNGASQGGLVARQATRATSARNSLSFLPFSSSSDSGLVSFAPINRGTEFFDRFSASGETNTVSPTPWSQYSTGAHQCSLLIDVSELADTTSSPSGALSNAAALTVAPTFGTTLAPRLCRRGDAWNTPTQGGNSTSVGSWSNTPPGNLWPIQDNTTANIPISGRARYLTLDLQLLPAFLNSIGAETGTDAGGNPTVTVNNKIWIGPRYSGPRSTQNTDPDSAATFNNTNIAQAQFPSTSDDFAIVITASSDLSAYPNGLSIVTPWRVYYASNLNTVSINDPVTGAPSWFPPVAIYSPEKRFGTSNTTSSIDITGSVGYLPSDTAPTGGAINPLDLRDANNNLNTANITANLSSTQAVQDLPPINSVSWLTIIEEVKN